MLLQPVSFKSDRLRTWILALLCVGLAGILYIRKYSLAILPTSAVDIP
jgi:hypothetical protein